MVAVRGQDRKKNDMLFALNINHDSMGHVAVIGVQICLNITIRTFLIKLNGSRF